MADVVSILVFLDFFATYLRYRRDRRSAVPFQSLFSQTSLQPNSDWQSEGVVWPSFNPCFLRLLCNRSWYVWATDGKHGFQSLFSQTSLQRNGRIVEIALSEFQSLFSQTSLQLNLTLNVCSCISRFNPCFLRLLCNQITKKKRKNWQVVSILVFLDFFATCAGRNDTISMQIGFNPCFLRLLCNSVT